MTVNCKSLSFLTKLFNTYIFKWTRTNNISNFFKRYQHILVSKNRLVFNDISSSEWPYNNIKSHQLFQIFQFYNSGPDFLLLFNLYFMRKLMLPLTTWITFTITIVSNSAQSQVTYSCNLLHMDRAVLSSTSEPSRTTQSHTRRAVAFGRQVANNVKNHCMVNTFVSGGS